MDLNIKGIIPPMVTPFLENGELDLIGLNNLIEHLINGGVHGIFLLGTNGEGPSMPYKLRKQLIEEACKIIDKRLPVYVGITDSVLEYSVEIAHVAKDAGADVVVVAPPYYFPLGEEELEVYFEELIKQLPLPFVLYNMPSCTKIDLSIEFVKKFRKLGALGIKDSSGDLDYLQSLTKAFKDDPEFSIMVGTELYIPETIMAGGHGSIAGGANFYPELFVAYYNASVAKDKERLELLRKEVALLYETIYAVGDQFSRFTKGTKGALSVLGICEDHMLPPLKRFNDDERALLAKYISEYKKKNILNELSPWHS
ncbi:MAG: dihydrodipicolinate synthase family protein [Bacteroidota bacterium]